MSKFSAIRHIFPFLLVVLLGCGQTAPEEPLSLSDPIKELIQICSEESNFNIWVTPFDNTVWIYLPLEENIFQMKATPKGPMSSDQSSTKPTVKFLEGFFKESSFYLKFDIVPSKGYAKDYGYTSEFSQEYKSKQRSILTAINRVYNTVENPPPFFVLIIADIVNGLESRTYVNFGDLKRAYMDQSFHEEYAKRIISEQPTGNIDLIGDETGQNVNTSDLTWPDFLAKQMVHRINFKYQRSAFPPSDDTINELLPLAAQTLFAYDFNDFDSLELIDLNTQIPRSYTFEELASYKSEESKGRLIHIKFQ